MGCGSSSAAKVEPTNQSTTKGNNPDAVRQHQQDGGHNEDSNLQSTEHPSLPPPSPPPTQQWSALEQETLNIHNNYRRIHGVPPLTLDRDICTIAQQYAETLARQQKFEHSSRESRKYKGEPSGENLASSSCTDRTRVPSAVDAVRGWYDEIQEYDYNNPKFTMATGHFTQVVWKDSRLVGVGRAMYDHGNWRTYVTVANYHPPGNYEGQFSEKVPAPQSAA